MEYVIFPRLDISIPVRRVLFSPFGISIYTYGVIIACALFLAVILGLRSCEKYGIQKPDILDLMIFATPISIIMGMLYYAVFKWENFVGNPLNIIARRSGIGIYGAIIGALVTATVFAKVKKINILNLLDFGVPYLIMGQAIGRWGNFVNQEAFGINTNMPWGMTSDIIVRTVRDRIPDMEKLGIVVDPLLPVHPTFLYESLWNFLIFALLLYLRKNKKFEGQVLLGYLIGYGVGRAYIEGLRIDSLMLGNFRISQLLSVILLIGGTTMYVYLSKKSGERKLAAQSLGASGYGDVLSKMKVADNDAEGLDAEEEEDAKDAPDGADGIDNADGEEGDAEAAGGAGDAEGEDGGAEDVEDVDGIDGEDNG
ncbi:MAG: prolipoprotein diacylglyceryl transferase [Oscillospiraceae bacterium]|nr:prolipoprotein diacylglyceryl transferase [Oscillospiraceae bacterium]